MELTGNELKDRRLALVKEQVEIAAQLSELGLTTSRIKNRKETISAESLRLRSIWSARHSEISAELVSINKKLKRHYSSESFVKEILIELMGADFVHDIFIEAISRLHGNKPNYFSLPKDEKAVIKNNMLRLRMKDYHEMIISARKAINSYIYQNEPEINKADFLLSVSSINKCLPPVTEIERDKSVYNI